MDSRFLPHNSHLDNPTGFAEQDPQLRRLSRQTYQYRSDLLDKLVVVPPGIYTLGGGRQIGKTTLLKQWMNELLKHGVAPATLTFFSGELINDHHSLVGLIQNQLGNTPTAFVNYLIIDEVTYIQQWDKAVKYAADAGMLEQTVLVLTGSDLGLIRDARMRFPGRRGTAEEVDFHMYPLSFRESLNLKIPDINVTEIICQPGGIEADALDTIYREFDQYLLHGGYFTAINDLAEYGHISKTTLNTYSDWIRGDVMKRGKQESYLREILTAIIRRYNSQVTWNALARDLSIDHPKTVADYIDVLKVMDAVFVQSALLQDKLIAAPKKARKLMFCDPFIFHAIHAWVKPVGDPYNAQILPLIQDPEWASRLVEAAVITHHRRFFPTYYIKARGEVDIIYVNNRQCYPIEIKWTNQLRPKDIKQISQYPQGEIWTKNKSWGDINGVKTYPLPLKLLQTGEGASSASLL